MNVNQTRRYIADEVCKVLSFLPNTFTCKLISVVVFLPAFQVARTIIRFDKQVAQVGLNTTLHEYSSRFLRGIQVRGRENIPIEVPVLIASNHPGSYDVLVIGATIPRNDLKITISGVPITQSLPAVSQHLIYVTGDSLIRMRAVRQMIHSLNNNDSVLIFPTGLVDPDPAFMSGSSIALENWSFSLEIILRKAPETLVLPTIVSGVLLPKFLDYPFVKGQKSMRQRQKVAEYFQIIQQLIFPRSINLYPCVSYGEPISLTKSIDKNQAMNMIIDQTRSLLLDHVQWVGGKT